MIRSYCLCSKKPSSFFSYIEYKNESVFKNFEGVVIGKCKKCDLLKTLPPKKIRFDPTQSRNDMYESQRSYFFKLFEPIIDKIKTYQPSGSVLEVGCSSGLLLELLKKEKYRVYGIEPNKKAFRTAQRKFGNQVYNATLAAFTKKNPVRFNVIIYNHVLEHIEDIKIELSFIKKILKKDGIFVLGLPNTNNVIFYLRKKYWEPLMPLEHVWHFSKNYLVRFLERNKFKIINISYSNDERLDYPLIKRIYFSFLSFINTLMYTGEAMLLIAQKSK